VGADASREDRLKASQALRAEKETGKYGVQKTGRSTWELSNGVVVQGEPVSSWKRSDLYNKKMGYVQVGDHQIAIEADDAWELDLDTMETTRRVMSAKDRDRILTEAVIPALQEIPPEHLKGLASIRFDSIIDDPASGTYHALTERHWKTSGGTGTITLNAWNQYLDRDHGAGLAHILKHEVGHHVWDGILSPQERSRYAKGLGLSFKTDRELSTRVDFRDIAAIETMKQTMATPITSAPPISGYGKTNVFEDFAEFYRGYSFLSRKVDRSHDAMSLWDTMIPVNEYDQKAFDYRLSILPMGKLGG
jgi:hypothetical protein